MPRQTLILVRRTRRRFLFDLERRLHGRPLQQPIQPRGIVWHFSLDVEPVGRDRHTSDLGPGDEAEVSVRGLGSREVLFAIERLVQYTHDALDLVQVAVEGGGDLFGMEPGEPSPLTFKREEY